MSRPLSTQYTPSHLIITGYADTPLSAPYFDDRLPHNSTSYPNKISTEAHS